ncbi:MAG: phenylalanine--tRNA ligase subunit beta [Candidatus Pacearchaeota archaeon]
MKISYNWLQNYFEEKLPEPEKISEGIIFHSFEVESLDKLGTGEKVDWIFDIKILPDRAHDCLSHWGIAKEISMIFDLKINFVPEIFSQVLARLPNSDGQGQGRKTGPDHSKSCIGSELKIQIEDDKCLRYMGRIVKKVKVKESPDWLKEKLKVIGQKSINNIVDTANFVMFDLGQPIHCFDLDKLQSSKIIIRNAKNDEKITTLDEKEINLDDSILVIADEKNPLAIAGIKGGTKAEVNANTKNIVIEVANFNSVTTRKTSQKIGVLTEAVKRYENEITPELCGIAMNSITDMIYALAGGEVEEIVDIYPQKTKQRVILVSINYINKRLGSNFSKEEIESVWKKLDFEYTEKNNEFEIRIPFLRIDLNGPYDLTEEVIRILGYDRLEEKLPEIRLNKKVNKIFYKMLWTRHKLLKDGYSEVMTYSFCNEGEVEVLASASDKKFLRNNLTDGLKESIKLNTLNLPLLDMDDVKVFEIGTVFLKSGEDMHIAYGDKKNIVEISLEKFCIKEFHENSLSNSFSEVLGRGGREPVPDHLKKNSSSEFFKNSFKMWSVYPFISRDIAVWVPEGTAPEKLIEIYKSFGTELLIKEPKLFDSFTKPASSAGGNDKTSFAYRLVFQADDRTLTDEEINVIMTNITNKVLSLGFEVR